MKEFTSVSPVADAGNSMPFAVESNTLPQLGTKRDVGRMVQMSPRWVDTQISQGMPVLKLGPRRCRFDLAEVREWLRERYRVQRRGAAKANGKGEPGQ